MYMKTCVHVYVSSLSFALNSFPELTVGFNTTRHSGVEGDTIDVCVKILDGVLGPGILLDYIINAPRENPELPLGREADSATCM